MIRPTSTGSRIIQGDTPYGVFAVELYGDCDDDIFDSSGKPIGRVKFEKRTPKVVDPNVQRQTIPCRHRGDELRRAECLQCGGRVEITVFGCSIHRECSIKKDVGARICMTCPDYKPAEPTHADDAR